MLDGKTGFCKKRNDCLSFFFRDKRRRNRANRVDVKDEWPPREDDSKPSLNSISLISLLT